MKKVIIKLILLSCSLVGCSSSKVKTPVIVTAQERYHLKKDGVPKEPIPQMTVPLSTNLIPTPSELKIAKSGNPPFYEVDRKIFYLEPNPEDYQEIGIASWYGEKFQGYTTSSGELYDPHQLTAAHKTLPLPCFVEVTNLENNKRLILKVNDRGPFHCDRILDVSYSAAKLLGFAAKGVAKIRLRVLSHPASRFRHYIQVGAFKEHSSALAIATKISNKLNLKYQIIFEDQHYKVILGPVARNKAHLITQKLKQLGHPDFYFLALK